MRIGFSLPQIGPVAGPAALLTVARRAEEVGFDTVWVLDRLLWPVNPQAPYPASPDGSLPEQFKTVLDPLETLTFVAAHTSRVGLGTSVINLPYYDPVLLARRLTTIDVLSGGRLRVGFGIGWSPDEFDAVGTPMPERGRRADEALEVLKTIWTTDPVGFEGQYYRIPQSVIYPKPVQKPHPPIYLAAFVPAALRRVAQRANGWMPVGIPFDGLKQMWESIQEMAREAGRDPDALELVVRAHPSFSESPRDDDRAAFTGAPEQIKADIDVVRQMGAAELFFDVQFTPGVNSASDVVAQMERLWELAKGV